MSPSAKRTPSYRLHKPSGQAVVRLSGHDHYLGPHNSDLSRREYDRVIAEWLFQIPYRQTEQLGRALAKLMGPVLRFLILRAL